MKGSELKTLLQQCATIGAKAKIDPIGEFRRTWNTFKDSSYFLNTDERIAHHSKIIDESPSYSSSEFHEKQAKELCDFKMMLDKHLHRFIDKSSDSYIEIIDKVECAILREKKKADEIGAENADIAVRISNSLVELNRLNRAKDAKININIALSPVGLKSVAQWRKVKHSITQMQESVNGIDLTILKRLCVFVIKSISR